MSTNGFGGVRPARVNLCPVPLSALSVEDQALVTDAISWLEFVAEHRPRAAHGGELCPKCQTGKLRFFEPKRHYECAECSYVEPAPKTGLRKCEIIASA